MRLVRKKEAHIWCMICHHWFHDNQKFLPAGHEKLIAFHTGKRNRNGDPLLGPMIENNCFHAWHSVGREKTWRAAHSGFLPELTHVRFKGASQEAMPSLVGDSAALEPAVEAFAANGPAVSPNESGTESVE